MEILYQKSTFWNEEENSKKFIFTSAKELNSIRVKKKFCVLKKKQMFVLSYS